MDKSTEELAREIKELREEVKQMREIVGVLFSMMVEGEGDEDENPFFGIDSEISRLNN
jgi:hypothetical protein